jgi:hypothetical protein
LTLKEITEGRVVIEAALRAHVRYLEELYDQVLSLP